MPPEDRLFHHRTSGLRPSITGMKAIPSSLLQLRATLFLDMVTLHALTVPTRDAQASYLLLGLSYRGKIISPNAANPLTSPNMSCPVHF